MLTLHDNGTFYPLCIPAPKAPGCRERGVVRSFDFPALSGFAVIDRTFSTQDSEFSQRFSPGRKAQQANSLAHGWLLIGRQQREPSGSRDRVRRSKTVQTTAFELGIPGRWGPTRLTRGGMKSMGGRHFSFCWGSATSPIKHKPLLKSTASAASLRAVKRMLNEAGLILRSNHSTLARHIC